MQCLRCVVYSGAAPLLPPPPPLAAEHLPPRQAQQVQGGPSHACRRRASPQARLHCCYKRNRLSNANPHRRRRHHWSNRRRWPFRRAGHPNASRGPKIQNTKCTCDTGQTRNKLLEHWVRLTNRAAGQSRPGTTPTRCTAAAAQCPPPDGPVTERVRGRCCVLQ